MLTGEAAFVSAVVREPGEVFVIALPELRRLVTEVTTLGDLILRPFLQRRIIRRRSTALLDGAGRRVTGAGGPRRPLPLGR